MSHRESRGRGVSNAPAWISREKNMDGRNPRDDDRGGGGGGFGGGGSGYRDRDHHRRPPPPRRHDRRYDRDYDSRRGRGGGGGRPRVGGGGGGGGGRAPTNRSGIHFNSYEEERAWVEERRRRRHERKSLFDVMPTADQIALEELQKAALASSGPNPNVFLRPEEINNKQMSADRCTVATYGKNIDVSNLTPHQTKHARRLYVGNLPEGLSEDDVHDFFRASIHTALGEEQETTEDHIISVYINRDRRFAFIEFHSIDICTACLALDGIDVCDMGKVKVKRPNDYNPAMVPPPDQEIIQKFDASKLGIISTVVPDSPNKIFIGGLPYHLTEAEVLELLKAFGEVKAFHLVKSDASATTSKGYCFVEYADEKAKDIAVVGLNGMDMGNGKQLSAKVATTSTSAVPTIQGKSSSMGMELSSDSSAPPIMKVVNGVDIEALVDIAMGKGLNSALAPRAPPTSTNPAGQQGVLDIANAALAAAYGHP